MPPTRAQEPHAHPEAQPAAAAGPESPALPPVELVQRHSGGQAVRVLAPMDGTSEVAVVSGPQGRCRWCCVGVAAVVSVGVVAGIGVGVGVAGGVGHGAIVGVVAVVDDDVCLCLLAHCACATDGVAVNVDIENGVGSMMVSCITSLSASVLALVLVFYILLHTCADSVVEGAI